MQKQFYNWIQYEKGWNNGGNACNTRDYKYNNNVTYMFLHVYIIVFGIGLSYITNLLTVLCTSLLYSIYLYRNGDDIVFQVIWTLYLLLTLINSIIHPWLIVTLPIHFYMQGYKLLHPVYTNESHWIWRHWTDR